MLNYFLCDKNQTLSLGREIEMSTVSSWAYIVLLLRAGTGSVYFLLSRAGSFRFRLRLCNTRFLGSEFTCLQPKISVKSDFQVLGLVGLG